MLLENRPEDQPDKRTAEEELPNQSHGEVEAHGLEPLDDDVLRTVVIMDEGFDETHQRAHEGDSQAGDKKGDEERLGFARVYCLKGDEFHKSADEGEFQHKGDEACQGKLLEGF